MSDSALIEQFSRLQILVIGEAMLDRYLHGCATRLCQETPVPVVTLSQTVDQPGGAANTAVNLAGLGAQATLLSAIGDDWEGSQLQRVLINHDVATQAILVSPYRTTLTKQRVINDDQLLLRFDHGSTNAIDVELESQFIDLLKSTWRDYNAVIISDYGYGILTTQIIDAIAQLQTQHPKTLVIDAKDLRRYTRTNATAVKPNYQQTIALLNQTESLLAPDYSRVAHVEAHKDDIFKATGAKIVAVTLDQDGAIILQRDCTPYRIHVNPACPTRTIGAGDTFTAAFTIALALNVDPTIAANLAAAAAAIVVGKAGTAVCRADELRAAFLSVVSPF